MHKILLYILVCFSAYTISAQKDSVISIKLVTIETDHTILVPTSHESRLQKEIFENTPSKNVAEASAWTPGVYLQDYGGIGGLKTVSLKGLSSNYTGVFLNGSKVENTLATQIDLGNFDLVGCSELTISGPSSKDILKPASFYISPTNVSIDMSPIDTNFLIFGTKSGSFGLINPFLSITSNINSKSAIIFNSSYTYATGEFPFQYNNGITTQKETRTGADVERLNTYVAHKYNIKDSLDIRTQLRTNFNNQGLPGAVVLYNSNSRQSLKSNDIQTSSNLTNTKNKLLWRAGIGYSQNSLLYLDTSYFNTGGFLEQKYNQYAYTSSNSMAINILPKTTLTSALDYTLSLLRVDKTINRKATVFEVGIEQKLNSANIKAFYLIQNIADNDKNDIPFKNQSNSGGVSFDYYPIAQSPLKIYGSLGKYFRNPNFQELYYQRVIGDLKPENTNSSQVGINYYSINRRGNISWSSDIKYFKNTVQNKIISTPTQNLFIWSIQNLGEVVINGFESILSISYKKDSSFSLLYSNSYTYQKATDITNENNREYGHQIAYTPFDISKHILMFKRKNSNITLSSMYNGIRYSLGENIETNLLPSWWTHNISLSQLLFIKKKELTLQFQLNNILNKQYQIIKNFPMPGRYCYFIISLKL